MQAERFPGNSKAWLAAVVTTGLTISVAAGWSSFLYGNVLYKMMGLRAFTLMLGGVLILAVLAASLRGFVALLFRWRGKTTQQPVPGKWSFVWVSFQLACLLAVLTLGGVTLLGLVIGNAEKPFQGPILVLVSSGLLFLTGGAVRETSRLVRILRQ